MSASLAKHAIFHSVAAQFLDATNGVPDYEEFWSWLAHPANHELSHAFRAAWGPGYNEENAKAFVDVLAVELDK
jgi:hypothetical protein